MHYLLFGNHCLCAEKLIPYYAAARKFLCVSVDGAHCTGYKLWGERGSFFLIDFPNSNKRYLSFLIIAPLGYLVALCVFLLQRCVIIELCSFVVNVEFLYIIKPRAYYKNWFQLNIFFKYASTSKVYV